MPWLLCGGAWPVGPSLLQLSFRSNPNPDIENSAIGFRVASVSAAVAAVPEPSSVGLLVIGAMGLMLRRKRGWCSLWALALCAFSNPSP